jgi:tRNA(Phe) wybutosine-synthesizing methylase Tyw3
MFDFLFVISIQTKHRVDLQKSKKGESYIYVQYLHVLTYMNISILHTAHMCVLSFQITVVIFYLYTFKL